MNGGRARLRWFAFEPASFREETAGLSLDAIGLHVRLLGAAWPRGGFFELAPSPPGLGHPPGTFCCLDERFEQTRLPTPGDGFAGDPRAHLLAAFDFASDPGGLSLALDLLDSLSARSLWTFRELISPTTGEPCHRLESPRLLQLREGAESGIAIPRKKNAARRRPSAAITPQLIRQVEETAVAALRDDPHYRKMGKVIEECSDALEALQEFRDGRRDRDQTRATFQALSPELHKRLLAWLEDHGPEHAEDMRKTVRQVEAQLRHERGQREDEAKLQARQRLQDP
jgi:hypothetical protein